MGQNAISFEQIKKIGVVGAGQMGSGIAQVLAQKNYQVLLMDLNPGVLENSLKSMASSLDRLVKKNFLSEDLKMQTLKNIQTTSDLEGFKTVDVAIEAATENVDLKIKIFKSLDAVLPAASLLVTNTSSISITKLAQQTGRPAQVCGMHFMNPVPVMKLVEGIKGLQTSDHTFETIKKLTEKLDKVFVESIKDMPGFVVNRILMPMINEAFYVLHEGIAQPAMIDEAMKLGCNFPMGPLTLADFIGLDTCLSIMNVLYEGFADSKYRACPLLVKYVEAGWMGKKSGRGVFKY